MSGRASLLRPSSFASTAAWRCRWISRARRFGFQSDEATYYMMAHSLAADGDLEYRRADLVRVWREFPSGPSGVFLKLGRTVRAPCDRGVPVPSCAVRPGPRQAAAVLREVVHVSARRRAVRVAVRHQRISPAPRVAARTCRRGGLCLPGRAELRRRSHCSWRADSFSPRSHPAIWCGRRRSCSTW